MIDPTRHPQLAAPRSGAAFTQAPPRPEPARAEPPHRPADDGQRQRFENLLSLRERSRAGERSEDDGDTPPEADPSAWGLASPRSSAPADALADAGDQQNSISGVGDDDLPAAAEDPSQQAVPSPFTDLPPSAFASSPLPGLVDIQVPAPVFQVPDAQQARLYAHMALPLTHTSGAAGRFEVLDPSAAGMVSHVEVNTLPQGGLTVAVGTSVQHAALMDRHLPQLQRRLAERVGPTHLRVQESDTPRD